MGGDQRELTVLGSKSSKRNEARPPFKWKGSAGLVRGDSVSESSEEVEKARRERVGLFLDMKSIVESYTAG